MSITDPPLRLASVGDNCVDLLRPSGRRFIGGNAVNVAVQFARLGGRSTYFGAVGADENGKSTEAALRFNHVDVAHLVTRSLATARTDIDVLEGGERRIAFEDFGACAGYAPGDEAFCAILECNHVHIGWLDDAGALRRRLIAAGRSVSQDITVNASPENLGVEGLSIAFAAIQGDHAAATRLAASLFDSGARGVVVTRGEHGSSLFLDGEAVEVPARSISPVDTTGAGDSYIAAFLHARLSGEALADAGGKAAAWAAMTCLHEGGFPQPADGSSAG